MRGCSLPKNTTRARYRHGMWVFNDSRLRHRDFLCVLMLVCSLKMLGWCSPVTTSAIVALHDRCTRRCAVQSWYNCKSTLALRCSEHGSTVPIQSALLPFFAASLLLDEACALRMSMFISFDAESKLSRSRCNRHPRYSYIQLHYDLFVR